MKIICAKSDLVKSINIVSKAVPSKTTMPILECILIDASASRIKFTANDTELGIETIVDGVIESKGIIALNAKIFSDIIRKMPDSDVVIETSENLNTTLKCGPVHFEIMGRDGYDFTAIPMIEKDTPAVISQFSLRQVINQTLFSTAQNDTNKLMTGELFEIRQNVLRVASLDGHRVSIRSLLLREESVDVKVIVPGKTLSEVSRILDGGMEDLVYMYFTANHVLFEFNETRVVSRLIEGNYFRIDQMITSDYETKLTINRRELLDCLDRSTLLVREDDKKPIILHITDRDVELKITSQVGSMDEHMESRTEGKDLMIGFNPKFLMDALKVIDDEEVDMYFVNPKSPCFIRNEQKTYIYLVLPVNFVS